MKPKRENSYIVAQAKKLKAIDLLGGKCVVCGEDDHSVLDFHHKKSQEKNDSIRTLKYYRWSILKEEVKKCELLCGNCHTKLHTKNKRNSKIKKDFLRLVNKNTCEVCGCTDSASLDFHHTRDKNFTINNGLIRKIKVTVDELLEEASKCKVLCRNCHRREHFDFERYKKYEKKIIAKANNLREIQAKISRQEVKDMLDSGMKQIEIARHFNASKGTISMIVKNLKR